MNQRHPQPPKANTDVVEQREDLNEIRLFVHSISLLLGVTTTVPLYACAAGLSVGGQLDPSGFLPVVQTSNARKDAKR